MNIPFSEKRPARVLALLAIVFSTGGALLLAAPLQAQNAQAPGVQAPSVQAELKAFKVTGAKLVAATSANPGEVIEYQARYTNTGTLPAARFAPQLPVPDALVYVSDSAAPDGVLASTDGKNFAPAPLMRSVKSADGKIRLVAVPLREYKVLRWQLGALAPGQSVTVKARARVKSFADARSSGS